jgi:hypothetical protein
MPVVVRGEVPNCFGVCGDSKNSTFIGIGDVANILVDPG